MKKRVESAQPGRSTLHQRTTTPGVQTLEQTINTKSHPLAFLAKTAIEGKTIVKAN